MVSAISLCFLALGLSAVSSQSVSSDVNSLDAPTSERRTFKHGKPVKLVPLIKKHKKLGGLIPHVFSKTSYAEIPIIHEPPKPFYKVHRYQGIEVKPVPDVSFVTSEPIIETHSAEPDFVDTYSSDHSYPAPVQSSSVLLYPIREKPIFPQPLFSSPSPASILTSFPPPPPKPIFSFIPAPPSPPVYSSIPITAIQPSPALPSVAISRPAFPPPVPVFTPIPAPPPPPQPVVPAFPIKVLPPLPASSPAPVFSSVPIKIQAPILPSSVPSPGNVFSPVSVKIPIPVAPSLPAPSPAPVFSSIPALSPTTAPSLSVSLPPPQFSIIPSSAPSLSPFPPPSPSLPSISIPANIEPEYPYPPSGTPIPSYIKDISLGDIELKETTLPTIETPKYEDVTPAISDDGSKNLGHVLGVIKNENGFFQKIKEWKADKANAALSHFTQFKQKPIISPSISISPNKIPVPIPTPQVPVYSNFQFPGPNHQLPLAPAPIFFPPAPFFPSDKYEKFPPNNIESLTLFNSYGVPIPHDSYAPPHVSHERLSSDASEEKPAVVSAPSEENLDTQQQPTPTRHEFQSQLTSQAIINDHPIYVPENDKTVKEENKTIEDVQLEADDYKTQKEQNLETNNYSNHKE